MYSFYCRNSNVVTVYEEVAVEIPESNVKSLTQKQHKVHPLTGLPLLALLRGIFKRRSGKTNVVSVDLPFVRT
jgi:hypothetical protein